VAISRQLRGTSNNGISYDLSMVEHQQRQQDECHGVRVPDRGSEPRTPPVVRGVHGQNWGGWEFAMTERQSDSVGELIGGVLSDARDLIREEIAMLRAEVEDGVRKAKTVGLTFSTAAVLGGIGLLVLALAAGGALSELAGWPLWAGYAVVAALLLIGAGILAYSAVRTLSTIHGLPRTRATLQENLAWIQSKSTQP
jgi:hypothetical protein